MIEGNGELAVLRGSPTGARVEWGRITRDTFKHQVRSCKPSPDANVRRITRDLTRCGWRCVTSVILDGVASGDGRH